jgi:protein SCO1/2
VSRRDALALLASVILLSPAMLFSLSASAAEADDPPMGLVPRYLLRDPNGRATTEGDFRGRFQLITFGYTFCPDICPTTLIEMADILKRLDEEASRLQAIFVSVDPERDTPEQLKVYTAFFDPRILGLTASPELVRAAADRFRVRYEKVSEPGAAPDRYSVDHSAGMYLLGPDGGFLHKFAYQTPTADVAERIREFMKTMGARQRR